MVDARTAGVLFTADPNAADTSTMIIEGNWGLGESVVSGEVTPDIYVLAKDRMEVSKRILGQKSKYVSLRQVGVAEEDAPDHKRSAFCLSDDEVIRLAEIGQLLENHFGVPQDVEWAIEENTALPQSVVILQSRGAVMTTKKSAVDQVVDLMLKWL
jgi:pyruvate,water dikinase